MASFTLFNSDTSDGSAQNNLCFNIPSVASEPPSVVLGLTALVVLRRRR